MKKNLLLLLFSYILGLGSVFAESDPEVVFYIFPPSGATGNYSNDFAVAAQSWSVPDMTVPANAIIGDLVIAFDADDSLICNPPVVNDVDGKIAVLWRGVCEFGAKALACQEAGAIGVVIVNHSGDPEGMGGGAVGVNVTIPTVMVSTSTGEIIAEALGNDEVLTIFHGNKTGYYDNDIGFKPSGVIRSQQYSSITGLSLNEDEFSIPMGAWITNFGSNDQTGVVLSGEVNLNGNELYNETATVSVDINSGDSAFVALPLFAASSYETAIYDMAYTVVSDSVDEFDADNTEAPNFAMSDTLYTYSSYQNLGDGPTSLSFSQPGGFISEAQQCIQFSDPNASRIGVKGMTFAMSTNAESIDGEVVEIFMYEWLVDFTDLNDTTNYDPETLEDDLEILTDGYYEYFDAALENENIYVEFNDDIVLIDNARYLFCVFYTNNDLFLGYDSPNTNYTTTQDKNLQPYFTTNSDGTWFLSGFIGMPTPGIALNTYSTLVGIDEVSKNVDVTPYPNPAQDFIQIPMVDVAGLTTVQIFDVAGKLVETQNYTTNVGTDLRVDVSNLEGGVYTFALRYESGNVSNFNVVITK